MTTDIRIEIKGADKLIAALQKEPEAMRRALQAAGEEAGRRVILSTAGLKKYPGFYHAKQPFKSDKQRRFFFWALREGVIEVPYRRGLSPSSERYGTQFYIEPRGSYNTAVGNRASYAEILGGEGQSRYMAAGGWRKLAEVATEKLPQVRDVFQAWVDRTIRGLGL